MPARVTGSVVVHDARTLISAPHLRSGFHLNPSLTIVTRLRPLPPEPGLPDLKLKAVFTASWLTTAAPGRGPWQWGFFFMKYRAGIFLRSSSAQYWPALLWPPLISSLKV